MSSKDKTFFAFSSLPIFPINPVLSPRREKETAVLLPPPPIKN